MKQSKAIELYSTDAERKLAKAVFQQIGNWQDIWNCPENYRDASGGVNGFISYYDTHRFTANNIETIFAVISDWDEMTGVSTLAHAEQSDAFCGDWLNYLAWWSLETVIMGLMDLKEIENA